MIHATLLWDKPKNKQQRQNPPHTPFVLLWQGCVISAIGYFIAAANHTLFFIGKSSLKPLFHIFLICDTTGFSALRLPCMLLLLAHHQISMKTL